MEYATELGYFSLFWTSFLAATILPLSSEVVLSYLLWNDFDPVIAVCVAAFGNVLGSFVNYGLGYWGGIFFIRKIAGISEKAFSKAKLRFRKYGVFSLLFAWVPVIGDPLTVVAGVLRINLLTFLILVATGKLARYIVLCYAVLP